MNLLRHPRTALAAVALAALGGLALTHRGPSDHPRGATPHDPVAASEASARAARAASPTSVARACRFDGARPLAYDVSFTMEVSASERPQRLAVDGRLALRFVRDDGERATLAARFTPSAGAAGALASTAATPMVVEVDRRCRFTRIAVPEGTAPAAAQFARGLLRNLEVVLHDGPAAREWVVTQRDAAGSYEVAYRFEGDDPADPGASATRRRLRFVAPPGQAPQGSVEVVASQGRFALAADAPWLRSLDASERLRLHTPLGATAEVAVTTRLRALTGAAAADVALAPLAGLDGYTFDEAPVTASPRPQSRPDPVDPALASMPAAEALTRYRALVAGGQSGVGRGAHFLASYFRARPAAVGDFVALLRAQRLSSDEAAPVFLALQLADTDEARQALVAALRDPSMRTLDRERAAIALSQTGAAVRPELVDALTELATRPRGREPDPLADTAMRALGGLGLRARGADPALASRVTGTLVRALERAGSDLPLRAAALDGIGNSGDPSALDAIAPYVDSASEITRAAAVTALRQMDDARAAALLARRFAVEPDAPVRTSIVQALAGDVTRPPPPHAVDLAIRALPQEADRAVRAALIVLLGEAAATHPGARAALAAQYPREREATMLRLLGRYLSVEEMS
jgi:HEAT repeat protein